MAERAGVSAPINLRGKLRTSAVAGVLGGLVFGYAAGVIAAAAGLQLTAQFNLSAGADESCRVGVAPRWTCRRHAGWPSRTEVLDSVVARRRRVGRQAVGALLSAVVPTDSTGPLIATRLSSDSGLASSLSQLRGTCRRPLVSREGSRVATFQLMICVGFLVSYFSGLLFAGPGGWRPHVRRHRHSVCAALVVLLLRSTQTPTDLYRTGRHDELTELLAAMEPDSDPSVAADELVATLDAPQLFVA